MRVYDVGESEFGDPFIVMELLQGETLAKRIARGRLSAVSAVQLLLPIIDALAVAHERGIVHRDLKPDNLMLAQEQERIQPKILDFGVAKLTDPRDCDHKLTDLGTIVGSPEYMSPEQARGSDDVDAASDIWAVCVVLYEAITGVTPFAAGNYNALLRAIVEDEPQSLIERGAGDAALWAIVKRGLAKGRAERYASIGGLGSALASWLMRNGVLEDASGTALESHWGLSRVVVGSAEEQSLSSRATTPVTAANYADASEPYSRGAFTATVRARNGRRSRTVQAVLAACAMMGAVALLEARAHSAASVPIAPAALLSPAPERASRPVAPAGTAIKALTVSQAGPPVTSTAVDAELATRRAVRAVATAKQSATASVKRAAVLPSSPALASAPTPVASALSALPTNGQAGPLTPAPVSALKSSAKRPLDLLAPY